MKYANLPLDISCCCILTLFLTFLAFNFRILMKKFEGDESSLKIFLKGLKFFDNFRIRTFFQHVRWNFFNFQF